MRTALFLLAGLLLLAALFVLGRQFASNYPASPRVAIALFLLVWLAVASFNMWVGVVRAGYGAGEELPIFLLIFGVPAAAAIAIHLRFA
jgi:hypothetical protein